MKSNSWKKEWLVVQFDDYDNTWSDLTIPCTFNQASAFIKNPIFRNRLGKGLVKIVTLDDFAKMQAAQTDNLITGELK